MATRQPRTTPALWLDAARRRWALRHLADESPWQLGWQMTRWLALLPRQSQWLRRLDTSEMLRHAARVDPHLYERWHRPYISRQFDLQTRHRIVAAHYDFLLTRFPAPLRDRLLRGHSVRVATLFLEDSEPAFVHLRKPPPGAAGELALLVQTGDRTRLASCVLTFAGQEGLLVGSVRDHGQHADGRPTSAFIQGSHGLHPRDLLISLLRELAMIYGFSRLRAASAEAAAGSTETDSDAFWQQHGGMAGNDGCLDLPLSATPVPCTEGPRSRRLMQEHREAFRKEACARFADAFADAGPKRSPSWSTLRQPMHGGVGGSIGRHTPAPAHQSAGLWSSRLQSPTGS